MAVKLVGKKVAKLAVNLVAPMVVHLVALWADWMVRQKAGYSVDSSVVSLAEHSVAQ